MKALAESLSPAARRLLLRDGVALEDENARTRRFIEKFRIPNPLRLVHAKAYEMVRVGNTPVDGRLLPEDREVVEALRFHFSGQYESAGSKLERWIGPDGCICIECSGNRRFLTVGFEDDHRFSMWPDLSENTPELFPTTEFLVSSHDMLDDYRRMLEKTAAYIESTSVRPLYRHANPDLDLACVEFYMRHQTALEWVRFAASTRFWTVVGEKLPGIGGDYMSAGEARNLVAEFNAVGRLGSEDAVLNCRSCKTAVYVPFEQIGTGARCDRCGKQVGTTDAVLHVYDSEAMNRLIETTALPVVACFWSPESWESTLGGASFLHDANLKNDNDFVALLVDTTVMDELAKHHAVTEVPTFVRFKGGRESGRYMSTMSPDAILTFARS